MARIEDNSQKQQPKGPTTRTECCGAGAYGLVYGIYLIHKPKSIRPTQTAERIGGFRGCSKCFKPIGYAEFRPGKEIPRDLWLAMVARASGKGGHYTTSAYYAQRNDDGTITLYDWKTHPIVRRLDRKREQARHTGVWPGDDLLPAAKGEKNGRSNANNDGRGVEAPADREDIGFGDAQEPPDDELEEVPF